jgi:hypothetical protein
MSDPFYRSRQWKWLREQCLTAHPFCVTAGCNRPSVVADHVIPRSQGGTDTLDNLVGRCIVCHNTRRGTAEPQLRGCDAKGTPRDKGHWWHQPAPGSRENLSGLSAGTAPHGPKAVSSARHRGRR